MDDVVQYITAHQQKFVAELKDWLRIPSVSTDPSCRSEVRRAATFIAERLEELGLDVELVETPGHPIVWARGPAEAGRPTVVVYGHYDVQPADPLEEWLSPPFEPTVRDGNLYARGATDDKGQLYTHVKSVEAWIRTRGALPVNVTFLIEGEEEIGSPDLEPFVREHRQGLQCDCVVISDTAQFAPGVPAITYGLRGLVYVEIVLEGARQDLHSGVFGGAVANPANNLAFILGQLVGPDGKVRLPGFYEDVAPLEPWERRAYAELPFDPGRVLDYLGIDAFWGEEEFTILERTWARPTCDVNGLTSGFQGHGAKTIIPAKARAKVSFRLVPHQKPQRTLEALEAFVTARLWPGIRHRLVVHGAAPAVLVPVNTPAMEAACAAIEKAFGRRPVWIREGGSIPVVATFKEVLGVDTLLLGWGQHDDNLHAPNEKFSLENFYRGTLASAWLWHELAQGSRSR